MGGPDATPDLWKQPFSAVRASGGYPGNATGLTPGHQGWNDLHSLCRIGMEYYLLNNDNDDDDDNDNKDDDDDNRNNNDNDYNHNNDANNDKNDNDKNSSDSLPVTVQE